MAAKPFPSNHILAAADVNDLVGVIDRSTGVTTVGNTAAETLLYTKTIAANSLSTDRVLMLAISGTFIVNTGGGSILTVRVKFGATTMIADGYSIGTDDADPRAFHMSLNLANRASTSSQYADLTLLLNATAITAATSGLAGAIDVLNGGYVVGTATEATTANKDLQVTVQWSGADANATISKQRALLLLA